MDDETRARRDACTRFLTGDGRVTSAELLAGLDDVALDVYGRGGVVAELEGRVAELLDKPAAVFLPSGTMAQGATLRVHAGRRGRRTVLWHPLSHLEQHEGQAHARLHGLTGRTVGQVHRLVTLADLEAVAEPVGALLLELPQRDLGGCLPAWEDLVAQVGWARAAGAAVHLDGARLLEACAGYGREPAEVSALFDTVYLSFYKGVGALPGCAVAGPADVVEEVREWRGRLGGTLHGLWPGAASALLRLDERRAEMPARLAHARAVAAELREVPGVTVLPDPPQTPMLHLLLPVDAETFAGNARRLAEQRHTWVWPEASPTPDPGVVRVELAVGRATLGWSPAEVRSLIGSLLQSGRDGHGPDRRHTPDPEGPS